ncbi:MAG: hypothetical protein GWP09_01825 [Nitrospiraceae bacterium]|nr:hypothetical protein [Nitrospiraceae bacterium]
METHHNSLETLVNIVADTGEKSLNWLKGKGKWVALGGTSLGMMLGLSSCVQPPKPLAVEFLNRELNNTAKTVNYKVEVDDPNEKTGKVDLHYRISKEETSSSTPIVVDEATLTSNLNNGIAFFNIGSKATDVSGNYTVNIKAHEEKRNIYSTPEATTFSFSDLAPEIDKVIPSTVTYIDEGGDTLNGILNLIVYAKDADGPHLTLNYRIDNGQEQKITKDSTEATFTVPLDLTAGKHKIYARVTDGIESSTPATRDIDIESLVKLTFEVSQLDLTNDSNGNLASYSFNPASGAKITLVRYPITNRSTSTKYNNLVIGTDPSRRATLDTIVVGPTGIATAMLKQTNLASAVIKAFITEKDHIPREDWFSAYKSSHVKEVLFGNHTDAENKFVNFMRWFWWYLLLKMKDPLTGNTVSGVKYGFKEGAPTEVEIINPSKELTIGNTTFVPVNYNKLSQDVENTLNLLGLNNVIVRETKNPDLSPDPRANGIPRISDKPVIYIGRPTNNNNLLVGTYYTFKDSSEIGQFANSIEGSLIVLAAKQESYNQDSYVIPRELVYGPSGSIMFTTIVNGNDSYSIMNQSGDVPLPTRADKLLVYINVNGIIRPGAVMPDTENTINPSTLYGIYNEFDAVGVSPMTSNSGKPHIFSPGNPYELNNHLYLPKNTNNNDKITVKKDIKGHINYNDLGEQIEDFVRVR